MGHSLNLLADRFQGQNLIEASAGTGKTWTLTALYARFLLEHKLSVGNILVVTYTTAATAELRERIRARLAQLLHVYEYGPGDDALLNQLHAQYPSDADKRRLRLAVHGFDEAAIFTIHGFCQRALQDAAFEAGGDFDNELTQSDAELIDEILADLWRQELAQAEPEWASFLAQKKITPLQLRQSLSPHLGKPYLRIEPSVVGPRLSNPLQQLWQQAQSQWQAHSAAVCAELSQSSALNARSYDAQRIALWQNDLNAYFIDFAGIFSQPDALQKLATTSLIEKTKSKQSPPVSPLSDALQALLDALSDAQPRAEKRLIELKVRLLQQLNQRLPQRKAELRMLAFDDLLNQLDLGLKAEGGAQLAKSLREQYPLALIDEFQDTDPIQYSIFSQIYQGGGDLCFVGDPKQAIYAFRGADLATYLAAKQQAQRTYSLDTNHRSSAELISALNQLFTHPAPFAEAALSYPQVKAAAPKRAPLVLPNAPKALNFVGLDGSDYPDKGLSKEQADHQAASDCAIRIAQLLAAAEQGQAYFAEAAGPVPLQGGDIAILVSSHRQASLMAEKLSSLGVPSVRRGKENVWNTEEASELEAVLRAYAEPGREALLRHALLSRLLGRNAQQLADFVHNPRAWDAERENAERYHSLLQDSFMRAFRLWLDEQQVAERLLRLADGERRLTNLLHLAELLQEQSLVSPGLAPLLAWFSSQRASLAHGDAALLRLESDAQRVQIVTIHTSKGLEYPLVFCPFLWNGALLPKTFDSVNCHDEHNRPMLDLGSQQFAEHSLKARAEMFAEKLRLLYVALTRARSHIWLHWGPVQYGPGYKGSEGLHTSALAWLLFGRNLSLADNLNAAEALVQLQEAVRGKEHGFFWENLEQLLSANPQTMALLAPLNAAQAPSAAQQRAAMPAPLQQLTRSLNYAWRMGSFSALTAAAHSNHEAPDRDQGAPLHIQEPGSGFYAFPRGARAGVCLHAIFEDWANGLGPLQERIPATLTEHGIDAALWGEIALEQINRVLDTPLDGEQLRLRQLTRRYPELGFTFAVSKLDIQRLRKLLLNPDYPLPQLMRDAVSRLQFDSLSGFMKGFIDLTFEYQGRWYILDYKSNWLGSQATDYSASALEQAIAAEHYYLQYLIYLVALRRFLKRRLPSFTDEQIGGAYYLFIRGMPEAGVYFQRPSSDLLEALDRLFSEAQA